MGAISYPHLESQVNQLLPLGDFNELLHHLRTCALADAPRGHDVLLSVGCADRWYFEWIERHYGPVRLHIGVHHAAPRPDALPSNVRWVPNPAGHMHSVDDRSVDMILCGQQIERLWPQDVVGFLLESHRVLRLNGALVIDSPNRMITSAIGWNHPHHTLEFSASEIAEMLALAGFDAEQITGLWMMRDPSTGQLFPLSADSDVSGWPFLRRVAAATRHPQHSFLWWIEARKSDRAPDPAALQRYIEDLYKREWRSRLERFQTQGRMVAAEVARGEGEGCFILFGPYVPLPAGEYTVSFLLRSVPDSPQSGPACEGDVYLSTSGVLARLPVDFVELTNAFQSFSLHFILPEDSSGIEFRVRCLGISPVEVKLGVTLDAENPLLNLK